MAINSLNKYNTFIVSIILLLASLDLFRAYLENSTVNLFFAFKEIFLFCLLFLFIRRNHVNITSSLLLIMLLTFFFCLINVNIEGILLSFIFLKYVLVLFLSYLIFKNVSLEVLQKGSCVILGIFFIYSIAATYYGLVSPDYMVRSGRISGFANPSFLSYIYLLCFLYAFFKHYNILSIWFIVVGCLTLTKTFLVTFFIVLIYLILLSPQRLKLLLAMAIIIPILSYVLTLNQEMYIAFDKALDVLINRDSMEYNSMDDRIGRISSFEKSNSGNFIVGYGTGKAGSAAIFLKDKMGQNLMNLTDFENQILNIFYSLGVLGLFLLYYPFINQLVLVYKRKICLRKKHPFYLFFIVFMLYNFTLNILESFTACVITLLFLVMYGKKIENSY